MDFYKPYFPAARVQVIDNFFCALANRAHRNDDFCSIRRAVVVERLVISADFLVDFVHILNNDFRESVVV